ncbi:hypothetical protein R3P38DRAFT_2793662 [Favolaschia claudopus]|uniref:Uncharacterized protein n=1 Tax=Favolaschia claudopus TaxID=2862362 RepID=A0AAW0ACF6_9AGAR
MTTVQWPGLPRVTFGSKFAVQAQQTFFDSVDEWETECAKFSASASEDPNFFCNPWAYSKRKSPRTTALVGKYWEAVNLKGNGESWEKLTSEPTFSRRIHRVSRVLLTADFVYAKAVDAPSAEDVGGIIYSINKGAVRGLELLGLVQPRTKGSGRTYKMGNKAEIKAAFCKLYDFLVVKLDDVQKAAMVFDAIMLENGLC